MSMKEAEKIMDGVSINQKSTSMGRMEGKTPNQLFKSYLVYFKNKYGDKKQPPTFKQFLEWGRHKGFISKPVTYNTEGEKKETDAVTDILSDATKLNADKVPSKMTKGKWLALVLLFTGTAGFIYALTRPSGR